MKKHMTQEVAIKSAWMILEGLGYDRARNGDLEKTVTAVYESAPAADVVEVRHGRWTFDDFDGDGWDYQCSECGGYSKGSYDYCYHCGAKMDRWKTDGGHDDG